MKRILALALTSALSLHAMAQAPASSPAPADPNLWLEDVLGEKSLAWVKEHNATSMAQLQKGAQGVDYTQLRGELLGVLNAKDRIPGVSRMGDWFYNLWQDEQHKRGLWRRTTLAEYAKAEPKWETVIDVDALGQAEGESWVFHGAQCLGPDYRRCLVSLSRGGSDAHVVREFDTVTKTFIKDGFQLPEAKSEVDWQDADHVLVGTNWGAGSLTDSGYPRVIKRWTRGTPLSSAVTIFEGKKEDVSAFAIVDHTPGHERTMVGRSMDFYNREMFLVGKDGKLAKIDLPSDTEWGFWGARVLIHPRSALKLGGKSYPAGSLLVADAKALESGTPPASLKAEVLFTPSKTHSLAGYVVTREHVVMNISDNVASRLEEWNFAGKTPTHRAIQAPFPGTLSIASLYDNELKKDDLAEAYFVNYADFLTPDTLYLAHAGNDKREQLKSRSAQFDSAGMKAEQFFATSKDGTKVPYFVITPKGFKADGNAPTLLYGYGGFEVSMQPGYSGGRGRAWLARGGVFVLANLRGGGEFGPDWHTAAVKENKQKVFDDFIAVAEDLIAKKISSPRHLGIQGGSNGGLLVGAVYVERPDLFNAVDCQVPLLDMRRYHTLLAGASWMAEYGNPDKPEEWAYISKYSPYQNLKADKKYPKVLFVTSTRDDRVHPGHARKMAALMEQQGHDFLYYENIEGGHGGAADNEQRATMQALEFSFLWQQLR
jgi:prolyl oligopeptidase